jgi:hypothetical protein
MISGSSNWDDCFNPFICAQQYKRISYSASARKILQLAARYPCEIFAPEGSRMSATATQPTPVVTTIPASSAVYEKLRKGPSRIGTLVFGLVFVAGLIFIGTSIARDLNGIVLGSAWPYVRT